MLAETAAVRQALADGDKAEFYQSVITALGGYLGWVTMVNDFSLSEAVALHFWYDFLLSATFFALDPDDSLVSARIAVPF